MLPQCLQHMFPGRAGAHHAAAQGQCQRQASGARDDVVRLRGQRFGRHLGGSTEQGFGLGLGGQFDAKVVLACGQCGHQAGVARGQH